MAEVIMGRDQSTVDVRTQTGSNALYVYDLAGVGSALMHGSVAIHNVPPFSGAGIFHTQEDIYLAGSTTLAYSGNGNLITVVETNGTQTKTTTLIYDANNNLGSVLISVS